MVALDGTLIAKAGFITGGLSGNETARASRWDDAALEKLKQVRVGLGFWVLGFRFRVGGAAGVAGNETCMEHLLCSEEDATRSMQRAARCASWQPSFPSACDAASAGWRGGPLTH